MAQINFQTFAYNENGTVLCSISNIPPGRYQILTVATLYSELGVSEQVGINVSLNFNGDNPGFDMLANRAWSDVVSAFKPDAQIVGYGAVEIVLTRSSNVVQARSYIGPSQHMSYKNKLSLRVIRKFLDY